MKTSGEIDEITIRPSSTVNDLDFLESGAVVAGTFSGKVFAWFGEKYDTSRTYEGHSQSVLSISCYENHIASASASEIIIFDSTTGTISEKITPAGTPIKILWIADILICIEENNTIEIFDTSTWEVVHSMETRSKVVCFTADNAGKYLFLGFEGGPDVEIWYTRESHEKPLATFQPVLSQIMSISVFGSKLVAGGADSWVTLWDFNTRVCLGTIPRLEHQAKLVSFTFNGSVIVSCGTVLDFTDADTLESYFTRRISTSLSQMVVSRTSNKVFAYSIPSRIVIATLK